MRNHSLFPSQSLHSISSSGYSLSLPPIIFIRQHHNMRSSLFSIAAFSAISWSTFSQAAPIVGNFDVRQSIHQAEQRAPYAPKTKLFLDKLYFSNVDTKTTPEIRDAEEDDVSVFDITDDSGDEPQIKHIIVPKTFPNDTTEEPSTESTENSSTSSRDEAEEQEVMGSISACGVDKAGRNYCRTSDGWFEYRCETGEVTYYRHMPYADEEVCSDSSIA